MTAPSMSREAKLRAAANVTRVRGDGHQRETLVRHLAGVPLELVVAARDGVNWWCVECGGETLAGGLRCLPHFQKLSRPGPSRDTSAHGTEAGHKRHTRRGETPCIGCKDAHTKADALRRAA